MDYGDASGGCKQCNDAFDDQDRYPEIYPGHGRGRCVGVGGVSAGDSHGHDRDIVHAVVDYLLSHLPEI